MLLKHNQRRARDIKELAISNSDDETSISLQPHEIDRRRRRFRSYKGKEYKEEHLKRALRPKNHQIIVRLSSGKHGTNPLENIRATRNKFRQKRGSFKASINHRRDENVNEI